MPAMPPTMKEGNIAKWKVKEGRMYTSSATQSEGALSRQASMKPHQQSYPLYPSVAQLLHETGVPISEADKIPASGPKGRLLKGDVLAYMGKISAFYSSDQSRRIAKLGHLDLSSVKPASPDQMCAPATTDTSSRQKPEPDNIDAELATSISLTSVFSMQKRIHTTLGITLPLSTFITRATEVANNGLPSTNEIPTAEELFDDVLGLTKVNIRTSRGGYIPQIRALPTQSFAVNSKPRRQSEVYDFLTNSSFEHLRKSHESPQPGIMVGSGADESINVFSVSVAKGEEKRAKIFLERVKTILQVEPGRLIL